MKCGLGSIYTIPAIGPHVDKPIFVRKTPVTNWAVVDVK